MKYITIFVLIVSAFSLKTIVYNAENQVEAVVGPIGRLTILEEELFFVGEDHRHFGYINKTNGKVNRITYLNQNQTIIDQTKKEELILAKHQIIYDYNVTTKKGMKDNRLKGSDVKEIKQYLRVAGGLYILTGNDVRFYKEGKDADRKQFTTIVQKDEKKGEKQNYIQLINLSNKEKEVFIVLVSIKKAQKQKQLCLKEFRDNKQIKSECYTVNEEGQATAERSGNLIYVSFDKMTYVIDENLEIKNKFVEKTVQYHQGAASTENGLTYLPHKNAIYEYRVIESQGLDLITMKQGKEEIIIEDNDEIIGRIQRFQGSQPRRSWIKKQEGKKYKLVIQYKSKQIRMYTLTKDKKGYSKTTENWKRFDKKSQ